MLNIEHYLLKVCNKVSDSTDILDAVNLQRSGVFIVNFQHSQSIDMID